MCSKHHSSENCRHYIIRMPFHFHSQFCHLINIQHITSKFICNHNPSNNSRWTASKPTWNWNIIFHNIHFITRNVFYQMFFRIFYRFKNQILFNRNRKRLSIFQKFYFIAFLHFQFQKIIQRNSQTIISNTNISRCSRHFYSKF